MRFVALVLGGVVTLSVATALPAQTLPPINLAALLDEARQASPELLESRARAEAAATVPDQRGALPDPKLTAEMIETSATVTLVVALAISVLLAALAVWFAGKVKAGTKKSRTGLMIVVLLDLFFQLIANGYAVVAALIALSGVVLFYFRQSSDYLTEREQLT